MATEKVVEKIEEEFIEVVGDDEVVIKEEGDENEV